MATRKKSGKSAKDESQKNELLEAILLLEKEKSISRDTLFDAIENYKNRDRRFGGVKQ